MEDISLHVLDIAENALRADAKTIQIVITKDLPHDSLSVEVMDDGRGMDPATLGRIRDPFFTTKQKKTGLGIPFLAQAAEQSGGRLTVESAPGRGTRVMAVFRWSHIDRPSIGDMANTLTALLGGHPEIDLIYEEREGDRAFRFATAEIKADLGDVPINAPEVLGAVGNLLKKNIRIRES